MSVIPELSQTDKKNNNTLQDDIKKFYTNYGGSFSEFLEKETNKSKLFTALFTCI